jgi:hypothetical protein
VFIDKIYIYRRWQIASQINIPLSVAFGVHLFLPYQQKMNSITVALNELFDRIPRRHSTENVVEINSIVTEYEDLLINIEAINPYYEKSIPIFFDELEIVKAAIKKSTDNKASKKLKDNFFDDASGALKDSMQALLVLYSDGNKTE